MLHLMKCRVLQIVRNRTDMFWAMLFPILLATFMNFAFGQSMTDSERIKAIPVALVVTEENELSENFVKFAEEAEDILTVSKMSDKEALEKLKEGEIEGIFYAGETQSLTVAESSLNTSILQSLLDSYGKHEAMIFEIAANHPENLTQALERLADYQSNIKQVTVGGETFDTALSYFFAVIAMACLYGCFIGVQCPIEIQANLSFLGARRSITPTNRFKLVVADMLATIGVHFVNLIVLLCYMKFILGIEFGNKMAGMLAICLVGSMIGVALGILVGSIRKIGEGPKIGIMLGVSMVASFLSGLMVGNMKDIIETNMPILNRINPAALISDAFYCLNVYDDMDRYFGNMLILIVMSVMMVLVSFLLVRRERYDSI